MPDFGAPVATQVNTDPLQGLKTISNLMSLQQQKQAIESQGLDIQQKQAQLPAVQAQSQLSQNKIAQQQAFAKQFATGKDDLGNDLNGANGEPDPAKIIAMQGRIAPLVPEVGESVMKTHTAKVGLQAASQNLDAQQRTELMATMQAIKTNPNDPSMVSKASDAMDSWAAAHPEMSGTVNYAKTLLGHVANVQDPAKRAEMANSLSALMQPGQAVQTQDVTGTRNLGNVVQHGTIAPPTAGGGFTPSTAGTMGIPPERIAGINPATGQPYTATFGGVGGGAANAGPAAQAGPRNTQNAPANTSSEWPKMPAFPSPQQGAAATAGAAKADAVRAADSHPVSGYEPTRQVYQNLLDLVAKNPAIGPKSGAWNTVTGVLTPFGASANSSMQQVDSYLDRLALQNASAAGLSTDAARHMSQTAAGTTEMNPEALKEKLRFGAATLEASHAYRQGLDKVIGTDNRNPIATSAFDSAWTNNADITAFRLLAAKKNGDKQGYDSTLAQIQSMSPSQQALIHQHMRNLNLLSNGHMPPP